MISTAIYTRDEGRMQEAIAAADPRVVFIGNMDAIDAIPTQVASIVSRCRDEGAKPSPSDYACRFCVVKGECGAYAAHQTMRDVDWFADLTVADPAPDTLPAVLPSQEVMPLPTTLSSAQLAQVMERAPGFSSWLEAVHEELTTRLLGGEVVEGWKVVAANTREKYTDEQAVIDWLTSHRVGKERFLNEPKLRTPKQVREGMKERGCGPALIDMFNEFVVKPYGPPTAVLSSDRRQPLVLTDGFDVVDSLPNT